MPRPLLSSIASLLVGATALAQTPAQRLATPATEALPPSRAQLPEVVVTTKSDSVGYVPPAEVSVTGLVAPPRELPITVNTVPRQLIDDTSAERVRDLVGYVPGVFASEDSDGTGDLLNIRGFDVLYQTYLNGLRSRVGIYASRNLRNIDHLEILKGPAGVEFGDGDPGGLVNFVTRKPQAERRLTLGVEAGSYERFEGYLDATGPLWQPAAPAGGGKTDGKDGKSIAPAAASDLGVFYRLIVSGESANSFRDTLDTDGLLVAPSLLWNYAEGSSVLLEFEYHHRDQPFDRGIIYLKGVGFSGNFAPNHYSYQEPDDFLDSHDTRTSIYWTHKLTDNFTLRLSGQAATSDTTGSAYRSPDTFLLYSDAVNWNGTRTVDRTLAQTETSASSYVIKPEVLINFETGPLKHTGVAGFQYARTTTSTSLLDGIYSSPIDFKNPVYGQKPIKLEPADPSDPKSLPPGARDFHFEEELEEYGVYYQHKIDILNRIHLLGGIRLESYEDDAAFTRNIRLAKLPPVEGFYDQNVSWRVGGVLDVTKNFSVFAGYSRSYLPQSGLLADGGHPDALEASSVEFGVKASFFDGRLQATASAYEIKRKNILQADPNDPTFTFVLPLGDVRVKGIEFELAGQITRDLQAQAGFTVMESEITSTDDPLTLGHEFYNVPNVQFGTRLRYDTSRWLLDGLSLGFGAIYIGDRAGDNAGDFTLPNYWRLDAGIYYTWRNWNFKVTCENLLDRRYYLASQNFADLITPGAPRIFTFGAEVKF